MVKQSWDYEGKRRARQKFAHFIISHKKDLMVNLRDAKVVCFPGYDEGLQKSLEIEMYQNLGIKNIVGIERENEVYEKLKNAYPEIKLYKGTDLNFFRQNKEKFDIVSLDYCGTLTKAVVHTLVNIFCGGLNDQAVLHTNFFAARDTHSEEVYDGPIELFLNAVERLQKDMDPAIYAKLRGEVDKRREEPLKEKRADGITDVLLALATDYLPIGTDFIPEIFHTDKDFNIHDFDIVGTDTSKRKDAWTKYYGRLVDELSEEYPHIMTSSLVSYVMHHESRPFFCDDLDRYRYKNPQGRWMYGDILFLNRHKEWFDESRYPIKIKQKDNGKREVIIGNNNPVLKNKLLNHIKRMLSDQHTNSSVYDVMLPERCDITSEYKPKEMISSLREKLIPPEIRKIKDRKIRNKVLENVARYFM